MTEHVDAVLEVLTTESSDEESHRRLSKTFVDLPPPELAETLAALAERVDVYGLGYVVFPAIYERLREPDCFRAVADIVREPETNDRFQLLALDVLDGIAREDDTANPGHVETLRAVAGSTEHPTGSRATATKLLSRHREPETVALLQRLVTESTPELADAVGHVVAVWAKHGGRVPDDLARATVEAANRSEEEEGGGRTRLLAALGRLADDGREDAAEALARVADRASGPESRSLLLRAAGFALDDDQLADVAAAAAESGTAEEVWALRAFRASHPARVSRLLRSHRSDAVAAAIVARATIDPGIARQIPEAIESGVLDERINDVLVGGAVAHTTRSSESDSRSASLAERIIRISSRILGGDMVGERERVRESYESEIGLADGLYRDLDIITADTWLPPAQHWHSALFLGLDIDGQTARMGRIEANPPIFDTVQRFSVDAPLGGPDSDVAGRVAGLRDDFVDNFQNNDPSLTYHGAYTTGEGWVFEPMGGMARERIAETATTLLDRSIRYTFIDQLDYNWLSWDGTPSDIDEIRCDGVIEYSYERHGEKVCEGKEPSEWNIARPGTKYPENHNDFHTWGWNEGEICPAVQGGGHGDDTQMRSTPLDPPKISTFDIDPGYRIPWIGLGSTHPPRLEIKVRALYSETAFVRIAVRPEGGEFHFLKGGGWFGDLVWDYFEVSTNNSIEFEWEGHTDGPSFSGEDGEYEIRVVAIDRNGYVSDEYARTAYIYWP